MRYRMTMTMMHSNQFFFFNDTATTEIYPLPLHAALPISRRGRATGAGVANSALPDLQAREPPHVDLLPRLGRQFLHEVAHRALLIPHELLLEQDVVLVELLDHALHDLATDVLGFLLLGDLGLVDLALPLQQLCGQILDPHREWVGRGDVHGQVAGERLEVFGTSHEVRFAVELDQHTQPAVVVDVGADYALRRLAAGPLCGDRKSTLLKS